MKVATQLKRSGRRFKTIFKQPFFWALTIAGNAVILLGSEMLYIFETGAQKDPMGLLDCLLWSTGTVTTIGYGSYMPQTVAGKLTLLGLMLFGTLFVWSYMAFLVTGLLAPAR